MDRKGFVTLGRVTKPHGLYGEFSMLSHADSPSVFDKLPCVFLAQKGGKPKKFKVRSHRPHKGRLLMRLHGIEGRDELEAWRGSDILARKRDLPESEERDVYLHELTGIKVLLEDGTVLGTVRDFLETPGQETWCIDHPDGKEILLPVVEEFVVSVDLDRGEVVVRPPEGLLELYLAGE